MNNLSKMNVAKKVHPKEVAVEGLTYIRSIPLYLMEIMLKLNFQEEPIKRLKLSNVNYNPES